MANPEHLAILKKGVEEWNRWRWKNGDIQPDLSCVDLKNLIFLRRMFFSQWGSTESLFKATFKSSDIEYADISFIDFSNTNLSHATFRNVNLS